jgi:alkylation response protein AidB-like acyl-CoA dehydrogenase
MDGKLLTTGSAGDNMPGDDLAEFALSAQKFVNSYQSAVDGLSGTQRARAVMAMLYDAGFSGITWPSEYGGQGLTAAEERLFTQARKGHALPPPLFTIGLGMCGPTLLSIGTHEQKRRYIGPLLRGEEIWCQLFSEPGAGSDLAGVQTSAAPEAGGWIVRGQKVWTSDAQHADFGILLARTDPSRPKNRGLTMFIVPMHAPGLEVRPLRDMTGVAHFNEVFLDDVRIPGNQVLGEVNDGWRGARVMLSHERGAIGGGNSAGDRNPTSFASLRRLAFDGESQARPVVRSRLVELYIRERAAQLFGLRLAQERRSGRPPDDRAAIAKLLAANLALLRADVAAEIIGDVVVHEPGDREAEKRVAAFLWAPAMSLGGGTNEIMRNIIGERVLGLPREPQADTGRPFRELMVGTQERDPE